MSGDRFHIDRFLFRIGFVLRRAGARAQRATRAVFRSDLNDPRGIRKVLALERSGLEAGRSLLHIFVRGDFGADGGMRTNHGALAALDAGVGIPNRDVGRDAAFFILRRRGRPSPVGRPFQIGYFQLFAAAFQNRAFDLADDFRSIFRNARQAMQLGGRLVRHFDFVQVSQRGVDSGPVLFDNGLSLLRVGLRGIVFNLLDCFVLRQNAGQSEVAGLHDRVDAASHSCRFSHFNGVDRIQLQMLSDDFFLNFNRQLVPNFFRLERSVQQEHGAFGRLSQHIDLFQEREMVAGNERSLVDQIRRVDDVIRKTQVGRRHSAGLLGVIHEISLTVGAVAAGDDLDRVLVRADRTVSTQTEEDRALDIFVFNVKGRINRQRQVRHVVGDTDCEAGLRISLFGVFKHGFRHSGRVFLGGQTVTTADHARHRLQFTLAVRGGDSRHHVQIQRFTLRTGFLRAIHDSDRLDRRGQSFNQGFRRERTIQMDFDDAVLLVLQMGNGRFSRIGARTHDDDNLFGVLRTDIVDQMILTAGDFGILIHRFLNDARNLFIIGVRSFANLEEHVGVLRRTAQQRVIRRQSVFTVERGRQAFNVLRQIFIGDRFDLVDFVRSAETVEEMHEGHAGFQRGILRNRGKVLCFLNVVRADHRQARLTAGHHVGMVAENRQSVRGNGTSGNMNDERGQFAGDFVQVRNHQQQALRRRKGRGQRACLQCAVNRADCAGFGLHFIDFGNFSPDILNALSRPSVRPFTHR